MKNIYETALSCSSKEAAVSYLEEQTKDLQQKLEAAEAKIKALTFMHNQIDIAMKEAETKLAMLNSRESYIRTIEDNYEDLANELELITGYRDEHFDTIMEFIHIIKPRVKPEHSFHGFGTPVIHRCNWCGQVKGKESKYCIS